MKINKINIWKIKIILKTMKLNMRMILKMKTIIWK